MTRPRKILGKEETIKLIRDTEKELFGIESPDLLLTPEEIRTAVTLYQMEDLAKGRQDHDREKIARKLASMDNRPFDDIKEITTSLFDEATQSHYLRRADEILALIGISVVREAELRRDEREKIIAELEDYLTPLSPSNEAGLLCMYDYELQALKKEE